MQARFGWHGLVVLWYAHTVAQQLQTPSRIFWLISYSRILALCEYHESPLPRPVLCVHNTVQTT